MKHVVVLLFLLSLCSTATYSQDLLSQQKAEKLFKAGIDLMGHDQYGAALENFQEYLNTSAKTDLRRSDAEYYKAFCALNLYHTDAEKLIQNFIDTYPQYPKAVVANYDLAEFYYLDKNYKKATTFYGKVDFPALSSEQQNTGHFHWGYSYFNQKQLKEALDQFNFIKGQGGQYGPAASYYAGFVEYSQGDYANALTDLKRAEQTQAYSRIVPYMIANVYYKQKYYDELLKYTASLSGKDNLTNAEEIALISAEAYFKKGDYKNALAGYSKYLEGKEDTADKGVLLRAGFSAYSIGQDAPALTYLKSSFTDKDSVGFYSAYYLGSIYLKQQQKPMALTAFDIARKFKSDPRLVEESSYQYAKISYDLGKTDQAIPEFEKLLKLFPNSAHTAEMKDLLSQSYVNTNNYNKALEYIESLPRRSPSIDKAYQKAALLKGIEVYNKEDYPQAVTYFEKSLQYPLDQDYVAEASFWCGEAYSIGKKYELAATQYLRVIGLQGFNDPALMAKTRYGLGYAYYNLQQYDRALFSFKEFVNKSGKGQANLADGVIRLADCYYVSKSYDDALANYRKAIQLRSPDADYAHMQAGVILGIRANYKEAIQELEQVVKNTNSSYFEEAQFQLAQLNFEQGNYAPAADGYTRLITINPSSKFAPYAYMRRAASYYNLKDYTKTAQDYITVIDNYPNHPAANDILLPLQEALNLAGRSSEFDKYLSQYKAAHPDAKGIESVEFETVKSLYFNQDYQKAIQSLGNYVASYPQSPRLAEAKYYQAESYYRLKDVPKALAIYYDLNSDKTFSFANKVTGRIAELEFKQGQYEKAVPFFKELTRIAANKKEQYTAWSGLMESYYLLAKYDSAESYARVILEKGNVNAGAQNKASLYMGKVAMAKGDYETAKDEFLNTLNSAQDEYGAEAKYSLAEIFYFSKEFKQCNETLFSLNKDFDSYTVWVGKSYLLLADSFLAMGETFQAKGTLKSLIDGNFPLQNVKDAAKDKLNKIDQSELKKQEQVKKDTVDNDKN